MALTFVTCRLHLSTFLVFTATTCSLPAATSIVLVLSAATCSLPCSWYQLQRVGERAASASSPNQATCQSCSRMESFAPKHLIFLIFLFEVAGVKFFRFFFNLGQYGQNVYLPLDTMSIQRTKYLRLKWRQDDVASSDASWVEIFLNQKIKHKYMQYFLTRNIQNGKIFLKKSCLKKRIRTSMDFRKGKMMNIVLWSDAFPGIFSILDLCSHFCSFSQPISYL